MTILLHRPHNMIQHTIRQFSSNLQCHFHSCTTQTSEVLDHLLHDLPRIRSYHTLTNLHRTIETMQLLLFTLHPRYPRLRDQWLRRPLTNNTPLSIPFNNHFAHLLPPLWAAYWGASMRVASPLIQPPLPSFVPPQRWTSRAMIVHQEQSAHQHHQERERC
jgi:hypothetical protein